MKIESVKEMVKPPKRVKFVYYRDNELWYETECGFKFPVPTSDIGNATFLATDKAMLFLRYVRKYRQTILEARGEL